jgi:hypothetical protein
MMKGAARFTGRIAAKGESPVLEESVTKLVPSAEADSEFPTHAFPALKRWAIFCCPDGTDT